MLSDHEQETLREIQRHLVVEDPEFERSFRAFEGPISQPRYRWVYTTLVVITVALTLVMLLAGAPAGALASAVVAVVLWWTRHLEFGTGERDSRE